MPYTPNDLENNKLQLDELWNVYSNVNILSNQAISNVEKWKIYNWRIVFTSEWVSWVSWFNFFNADNTKNVKFTIKGISINTGTITNFELIKWGISWTTISSMVKMFNSFWSNINWTWITLQWFKQSVEWWTPVYDSPAVNEFFVPLIFKKWLTETYRFKITHPTVAPITFTIRFEIEILS